MRNNRTVSRLWPVCIMIVVLSAGCTQIKWLSNRDTSPTEEDSPAIEKEEKPPDSNEDPEPFRYKIICDASIRSSISSKPTVSIYYNKRNDTHFILCTANATSAVSSMLCSPGRFEKIEFLVEGALQIVRPKSSEPEEIMILPNGKNIRVLPPSIHDYEYEFPPGTDTVEAQVTCKDPPPE